MNRSAKLCDCVIGLCGLGAALLILLVWIPADIDTGVIDVWRRSVRIGDAMLPTFAALGILISAAAIGLRALLNRPGTGLQTISLVFLAWSAVILALSITLMMFTGPALTALWYGSEVPYRRLVTTAPWKYSGFVLGGAALVACFTALVRHRFSWRNVLIGLIAALLIALMYDLPFDNLYLPPNGDV